jgi:hypothetical protein
MSSTIIMKIIQSESSYGIVSHTFLPLGLRLLAALAFAGAGPACRIGALKLAFACESKCAIINVFGQILSG